MRAEHDGNSCPRYLALLPIYLQRIHGYHRMPYPSSPLACILCLLRLDLLVCFDVEMLVGLQRVDLVFGELGTRRESVSTVVAGASGSAWSTYVKPLISLNSLTILPPWSVTCFFALTFHQRRHTYFTGASWTYESSSLALAPSLRETCAIVNRWHVIDKTREAYVDSRHDE